MNNSTASFPVVSAVPAIAVVSADSAWRAFNAPAAIAISPVNRLRAANPAAAATTTNRFMDAVKSAHHAYAAKPPAPPRESPR
jgi:hypothetical protein